MRRWISFITAGTLILSSLAFAGLGGDESTVQKDAQALGGNTNVSQHNGYRLHEISKNWVKVHEFAGNDGKVFALAWSGKKHPDLQEILGVHLVDFQTAISEARKTHHHGGALSITVGNMHVEMGGHVGAVYGQTWLTDQVPAGMDVHDIK
jgi:hypothetical protein